jgi:UDP-N-acetylmuramyl tripeptide synthase
LASLRTLAALAAGRFTHFALRLLGRASTTLPGRVALLIDPRFLRHVATRAERFVFVTGTNGKTTTNNILCQSLRRAGFHVFANLEGANLRTGIATAYIRSPGKYDIGCIESDEGVFPLVARDIPPALVVVTNFFRDQLDRYGEIDTTVKKLGAALEATRAALLLNADDPFTARLAMEGREVRYFGVAQNLGLPDENAARESVYCPKCGKKLSFDYFQYAQVGKYGCSCGFKTPGHDWSGIGASFDTRWRFAVRSADGDTALDFGYSGVYNLYNAVAAYAAGRMLGVKADTLRESLSAFEYRLGRQENFRIGGQDRLLVLVKNPAGYDQVLDMAVRDSSEKNLLLVLNDNVADGRDISWIWDVSYEKLLSDGKLKSVLCSGKRAFDLAVRLKYAGLPASMVSVEPDVRTALSIAVSAPTKTFILPTYTALFFSRGVLSGITRREK